MDFQKIIHDLSEAVKHNHWPIFIGWFGFLRSIYRFYDSSDLGDLGDAPGDNIPPKEILIALSSRREIPGRL